MMCEVEISKVYKVSLTEAQFMELKNIRISYELEDSIIGKMVQSILNMIYEESDNPL